MNPEYLLHPTRSRARVTRWLIAVAALVCLATPLHAQQAAAQSSGNGAQRMFTLKVLPVLKDKCFGCHGDKADDIKGDLDVRTLAGLLKGGESEEPTLIPGKPDESILYQAVMWDGYEMPPKENDRLTKQQTEYIREWIAAGAPWPDAAAQEKIRRAEWSVASNEDGVIVPTSGGLADEWTYRRYQPDDIWAFRPVRKHSVPAGSATNPIDRFLDKALKQKSIRPASSADPATLIRRAALDLTGLPPSPEDVKQFEKAHKSDPDAAWSNLIDRLLASRHYGERWAQHWLDVARYADTSGFSNDYERSNAWRYRDYVIRAFNNDKPFNEFVVEQIAGDELRPNDPEAIIATGFLRMGPLGTAMIPQPEIRQLYLDDLVHNVGQSFLSMPMRCCKCHDHKFDPIPTRDYYGMYAAFAGTQPAEVQAAWLPEENRSGFAEKKKLVEELLAYATAKRQELWDKREAAAKKWYAEHNLPYKNEQARKNDPEDKKPPRHCGLTPEEKGRLKVREQDCWIWERRLERFQPMAQAVYSGPNYYYNARKLRKKKVDPNWRPESFIFTGGALEAKGDRVLPRVLSGTGQPVSANEKDPYRLPENLRGRRLELAKWIASDRNPLTARSIVNRIWQYHFGHGLVRTPNNFGAKGAKPTHPELLDWLTADFIEHGWRIKRMHRLMMSSAAYQRAGQHPDLKQLNAVDPDNKLLARFAARRLTAEELRDGMLAVSGELNTEIGGLPIMPEINMEVALQPRMIQFSIAPAHQPSRTPAERNRRTIYAYRVRGQADPMLEILNQPNPNESCEMRDTAAVSPQAFTLMNSAAMTDRSIAFALRVQKEQGADPAAQVRRAVQLAYGREPLDTEVRSLTGYLKQMRAYHADHKPEPIAYPKQVTRSLVEEFTGEPFEFIERLNVYEDYVPDPRPWTVSDETRALADVCLLLLNSNEFVYVY